MFSSKVEHLIVDTSAFIKNVSLQDIAINVITEESVTAEVKSKRQLRRLVALPYNLVVKDVDPEHIKTVTEFSKKTGDYKSLSSTDIKVIALTLQLEIEKVGKDHIKLVPTIVKTVPAVKSEPLAHPKCIAGFFVPDGSDDESDDNDSTQGSQFQSLVDQINNIAAGDEESQTKSSDSNDDSKDTPELGQYDPADLADKFKNLDCTAEEIELDDKDHTVDDILAPVKSGSDDNDDNDDDDDDDDDDNDDDEIESETDGDSDDEGWITPNNIVESKKQMNSETLSEKSVAVACMTTDFAMQNVLMQMGLNVAALDGRIIKQLRTYIFRCYACFKKTSRMDQVFCPNCGMKTLKKVAVSLDEDGTERIHINYRKPLSTRGKRFSLPTPKGGKHANNPILCADQPIPQQRVTKLARMKNNPLDDDYIAGYSPFVTRDVFSKSAMLGIRTQHSEIKHWMKKNPNECRKKRK